MRAKTWRSSEKNRAGPVRGRLVKKICSKTQVKSSLQTLKKRNQKQLEEIEERRRSGLPLMESFNLSVTAMRDYASRWADFLDFVEEKNIAVSNDGELDMALAAKVEDLWMKHEYCGESEKLRAALEAFFPEYGRFGDKRLPHFRRSLQGHQKRKPYGRRWPLPEPALDLISEYLLNHQDKECALRAQLIFSTICRPGEVARLCIGDLICPVAGATLEMARYTIFLSPFERGVPTKTRSFDEAIVLDDTRAEWLGPAMAKHVLNRKRQLKSRGITGEDAEKKPMWTLDQREFSQRFLATVDALHLDWLIKTTYELRHGGASRDILMRLRTPSQVARRGRWSDLKGMKHYERHGRVQWILNKMGTALVERGRVARTTFGKRFLC